jgi:hypothetical protein
MTGKPMDGWANVDRPFMVQLPDGIQGDSMVDDVPTEAGTAGTPCAMTETRPDHGLPFKWASFQLAGPGVTLGVTYDVTIHFWGVVECKTYLTASLDNCTRAPMSGYDKTYDLWCPGATDPKIDMNPDHFNTLMVSVTPQRSATTPNIGPATANGPMPAAGHWWMLNECPAGEQASVHVDWMIDYEKTLEVPGGSWINFVEFDSNCRGTINCGVRSACPACDCHHMLMPTDAVPPPPASITCPGDPATDKENWGEWLFFDVKSILPK